MVHLSISIHFNLETRNINWEYFIEAFSSEYLQKARQFLEGNQLQVADGLLMMSDIIAGSQREYSYL